MYKKFTLAGLIIIFSSVFIIAGGVTNIKEVLNETIFTVEVRKYDTKPASAASEFETTKEISAADGT